MAHDHLPWKIQICRTKIIIFLWSYRDAKPLLGSLYVFIQNSRGVFCFWRQPVDGKRDSICASWQMRCKCFSWVLNEWWMKMKVSLGIDDRPTQLLSYHFTFVPLNSVWQFSFPVSFSWLILGNCSLVHTLRTKSRWVLFLVIANTRQGNYKTSVKR